MTALPTTDPRRAYFLLAHEVFHVLSRTDPVLRDDLYALLGFKNVDGFEYPAELQVVASPTRMRSSIYTP